MNPFHFNIQSDQLPKGPPSHLSLVATVNSINESIQESYESSLYSLDNPWEGIIQLQ